MKRVASMSMSVLIAVAGPAVGGEVEDLSAEISEVARGNPVDTDRITKLAARLKEAQRRAEIDAERQRLLTANASGDAEAIATSATKIAALQTRLGSSEADGDSRLSFSLGASYLDPFEIDEVKDDEGNVTGFRLDKGDAEIRPAFELAWRDRWAWKDRASDTTCARDFVLLGVWDPECGRSWPWLDFEMRGGAILKTSDDADGSSIGGASGEAWGTAVLGYPLLSFASGSGGQYSWNLPEFFVSAVSDEGAKDIHTSWLVGSSLSWNSRFLTETGRRAEGILRVGYVHAEVPDLLGNTRNVEMEHEFPNFVSESGVELDLEFNVPIGTKSYFQLRSAYLIGFDPNPWGLYFGWVTPIDQDFARAILPGALAEAAGLKEDSASDDTDGAAESAEPERTSPAEATNPSTEM